MSSSGSITIWIAELKAGDHAAAQRLWEGYFQRLVGLARSKLQALAKMEGYSNEEIAERLGCVSRTVERKLRVIRNLWNQEIAP